MGGSHSRSEDLRKRTFMNSNHFIDSLHEVPGYFTRTQDVTDFLGEDFPSERRTEMSYTGPPSHLSVSRDVHPFLDRFGPDYQPPERYVDRSQVNEDVPASLLPSAETAEDYRDIEVRETMATLKEQVKEALAKKRDLQVETVTSGPPEQSPQNELPTDEKNTLEFLDSIINESMDLDLVGDSPEVESDSEANWIMRDKSKTPLPGLMHSTVPDLPMSPSQSASRPSSGFFRNSMYLPDTDPIHSAGRSKPPPPPTKPKPTNRHSRHIPDETVLGKYIDVRYVTSPPPVVPIGPVQTIDILSAIDTTDSKNSSNASTEDMGIVVDDITSEEGSRYGEMGNIYDTKSRVKGVRALVSMYSEEETSPTERPLSYDFSPNDSLVGLQYPERDYMFGNNNNSNSARFFGEDNKTDTSTTYGTLSSEDSALGDGREVVDDAVLGVIHSELEKLRIN